MDRSDVIARLTGRLVERDESLAALQGALSEVKAGQGRLVLVAGEPGVGKTALVRTFCRDVRRSMRVLEGACDALLTPRPLSPLLDIGAVTGGAFERLLLGNARPPEVFAGLRDELAREPAVVVIEDAHWADEATLDVLRMLGRRIESIPALAIVTYRDPGVERAHELRLLLGELATVPAVTRLRLEPLSAGAVLELSIGSTIDADELYLLTSGNPFYVVEVLDASGTALPATVSDAVLARAGRVSDRARIVLEVVAVSPPRAEHWLVEAVCGEAAGQVDECVAVGMLVDIDGGVAFRHELARMAIENTLGPAQRRLWHRRLLGALQAATGVDEPARLAHHAEAAGERDQVLSFAPAAAEEATMVGAHREAAAQYGRALRFAGALPLREQADLLQLQSDALFNTDDQVDAIAALQRAIDLYQRAGDVVGEAAALSRLTPCLTCRGQIAKARVAGERAVAMLEPLGNSRELGAAYGAMVNLCFFADELDAAIAWGARAVELAREIDDESMLVEVMGTAGTAAFLRDGPRSVSMLEQALELARDCELDAAIPSVLSEFAFAAVVRSAHALAERYIEEGLEYCTDRELDLWRLALLATKARSELNQGRWSAAAEIAEALAEDRHDSPGPRKEGLLVLALVRARRGDPGAQQALTDAKAIEDPPDEFAWFGPVAAVEAELAWLAGRYGDVDGVTTAAFEGALRRRSSWVAGPLACWRHRSGGPADIALPVAEPIELELAGRPADAATAWRRLGCPYESALVLGLADDQASMERAHRELSALGARPAVAMVARKLRARGVRGLARGPRAATRANPAGLTARELEVLGLVIEGLSNAQIGQRLFLSIRTVDHHVSQILRKLDVPTRGRAAVAARRLGIDLPGPQS
jgi:DNA-binding CsgD family transcriptional regulator/tetratricopeptide (TPR) repeat protein